MINDNEAAYFARLHAIRTARRNPLALLGSVFLQTISVYIAALTRIGRFVMTPFRRNRSAQAPVTTVPAPASDALLARYEAVMADRRVSGKCEGTRCNCAK